MLIAVASSSGHEVDLHFGKATVFTLFEVDEHSIRRSREVEVVQYCAGDPEHTQHQQRFSAIAESLAGCRAVVSLQIGDLPRMALAEAGIQAFTARGSIETALRNAFMLFSAGE